MGKHPRHGAGKTRAFKNVIVRDRLADHQEQIFRLFTRLHGDRYHGTGIGLAIVQRGVERMGGKVGLETRLAAVRVGTGIGLFGVSDPTRKEHATAHTIERSPGAVCFTWKFSSLTINGREHIQVERRR